MWCAVQLNPGDGGWLTLAERPSIAECRAASAEQAVDDAPTYYFWTAPLGDAAATDHVIEEVLAANHGRIARVTIGLRLSDSMERPDPPLYPGGSVCVVQGSSRRCETYFCNGDVCWWVPCGIAC